MKRHVMLGLISGVFCLNTAYADDSAQCAGFHIQIANTTKTICTLTSQKLLHGNFLTSPPFSILPGDSKRFDMVQVFYGPEVMLSYQCGDEHITFTSKQNVCMMWAGDIQGKIIPPMPEKITAKFTAIYGSALWNSPGSINWEIVPMSLATLSPPIKFH